MAKSVDKTSLLVNKPGAGKKDPPTWVKVLAILSFINAALLVISAILTLILFIIVGRLIDTKISEMQSSGGEFGMGSGGILSMLPGGNAMIVMGIIGFLFLLGVAAFHFFLGRGLWKLKSWARIALIVLSGLGVISGFGGLLIYSFISNIPGIFSSLISVLLNIIVFLYLLQNEEVKKAFSN